MFARDFKAWAREALKGHWGTAVAVCLVASLLSGGLDLVSGVLNTGMTGYEQTGAETVGMLDLASTGVWPMMVTVTAASFLVAFVIGGAVTLGMAHHFINLTAHRSSGFGDLFSRFHILLKGIWMNIVMGFFTFLWSMLGLIPAFAIAWWLAEYAVSEGVLMIVVFLVVLGLLPGVTAWYRYAMVPYLIAEFPDLSVMDAMRESRRLMKGKKWRLFCLQLSFLGWDLLAAFFTLGIGYLWLMPYMQAADAAFYLDVTGRSGLRYEEPAQ